MTKIGENMLKNGLAAVALVGAMIGSQALAAERDQIHIVGSSTVFPFSTAVAEFVEA